MTVPSQYLRDLREEAARRRLELAKLLRENPDATNIYLAKTLGVNRDTIALDRKALVEQMTQSTLTETELLRAEMVKKLEALEAEVEKHRKTDGKLSLQAVDRLLDITKAVIELTGVRKPVNEKLQVTHRAPIKFETVIVATDGGRRSVAPIADAELITEPFALGAGDEKR
jgi:hypothetical protein